VRVLVVNAGSSTLKLVLLDSGDLVLGERELRVPPEGDLTGEIEAALADGLGETDVVGHRIVHGGERFREAVLVDAEVRSELTRLVDLAPLHQPESLAALDAVTTLLPGVAQVACFDTAFHATLPAAARTYALPAGWRERWPLYRFGFHGLSHAWIARRTCELLARERAAVRIVSCHLGAGASLCAIADGRSADTTMGFTPLEGLVMATRSGSVDPGLLVWLLEHARIPQHELAYALEHESGLLALAGTSDMRDVVARSGRYDDLAEIALEVYCHRLRAGIAAMAASLGGLDALVFTAGVGENSPVVRARAVRGLGFLGIALDEDLNADGSGDRRIGIPGAGVETLVIRAREDLEIARQVRAVREAS
jgi:acetate kinase